jgi:hypothetical protein
MKIILIFAALLINVSILKADTYTYYGYSTVNDVQNRDLDQSFWSASNKGPDEPKPFLSTVKHLVGSNNLKQTIPDTWKPISNKITLAESYDVRAYFVGEDNDFHDSFGFRTNEGNPQLIFANVSTNVKYAQADHKLNNRLRTASDPLFPGDFVHLSRHGSMLKGSKLDFIIIRDGYNTCPGIGPKPEVIDCSMGRMVCFCQADNPYLLVGCPGDLSTTLFAIGIGVENTKALLGSSKPLEIPTPEPLVFIPVIGLGFILVLFRKRSL